MVNKILRLEGVFIFLQDLKAFTFEELENRLFVASL